MGAIPGVPDPVHILVIEDDPQAASTLKALLEGELSASVEIAADRPAAKKMLGSATPDIVTLGFQFHNGDGLGLLKEITAQGGHPPVLMVTGHGDETTASSAIELGADGYVVRDERMTRLLPEAIKRIMEKEAYRESLRAGDRQYRELVELASSIILKMDREGNVLFINEYGCEFFGFSEEELVGRNVVGTIVPEVESTGRGLSDVIKDVVTEPDSYRSNFNENMLRDGSRVWILWGNRSIRDENGDVVGTLSIGNDVTERIKMIEALVESRAALARHTQELSDLLTVAAHELRHPATIFKGYSQILLDNIDDLDSDTVREALISIDSASDRLARTVCQLMDASMVDRGQMTLRHEEFEPRTLVKRVILEMEGTAAMIETTDRTNEGAVCKADRELLRSVLANLVENAVKFSPAGSPIEVCVEPTSGGFLFSVRDRGPGISEEHAEFIFERFYQVEDVAHHSTPGLGLGLYVAKTIVDEHGGWIKYRPGAGGGSVFEFYVPERPETDVLAGTHHEHVTATGSGAAEFQDLAEIGDDMHLDARDAERKLRVAVIDDDPDVVKVTLMMLESKGYEVMAACGGEEGVQMVSREAPDVVLLDIMMPGLDGFEACHRLKTDENTRQIPVIFVTAKTYEECFEKGLLAGADGFLAKPFLPESLCASIERVHASTPQ